MTGLKIGSSYYRQSVGIPQGSVLSTILCSFFYGDLEKRFTAFSEDTGSVSGTETIRLVIFKSVDITGTVQVDRRLHVHHDKFLKGKSIFRHDE